MTADVAPPVTQSMLTRDGVQLAADVYRPRGAGSWPVLLMRQPYGRRIASTVCYAHPAWYAAQGFIVVIQDVRGRGTSQGRFDVFVTEADDGADSIAWASSLEGSNGAVGMYGFSYQGSNQLLAAAKQPPALKAIAPAMIGWDLRADWVHENDAFALSANIEWAIQLAAQEALRAADVMAYEALRAAARVLPLHDRVAGRPDLLQTLQAYTHYFDWLDSPPEADYWRARSPHAHATTLTQQGPPALFIGGWFDTHLRGTVAAYLAYESAGRRDARLVVGPWAHFPWSRRLGTRDFGEDGISHIDALQVAWFNHWLKGARQHPLDAPVNLFDTGTCGWKSFAAWPSGKRQNWHLHSAGRAALDERDGILVRESAAGRNTDQLVHDPWRPAPAFGGAWASPAGPADRTALDSRSDVLTYTSDPLRQPLLIAGECEVSLTVQSDARSFDLYCVVSSVTDSGTATALIEGYRHFERAPAEAVVLNLRPACVTFAAGTSLRLSISAACFPAFAVNPGDGSRPVDAIAGTASVITLTIAHGTATASRLTLPLQG